MDYKHEGQMTGKKLKMNEYLIEQTENLINLVKNRQVLYDKMLLGTYSDKSSAWEEIATILRVPVMKCKEKWKSLRDSYVKTRRRTKDQQNGESSLPQPKEWKWTKHLMFLEDYLDPKGSCSDDNYVTLKRAENSITNDYSDVNGYEDPVSIQETNIVYFQDREDNCVEFDPASVSPFPTSESGSDYNNISRPQKRKRVSNNELKSDKSMKYEADSHFGCTEDANVRKSVVPELVQNKMDGEAAFGISVANDLMKLNESQRAYAKYKIQELLYKITSGITSPSHEQA